MNYIVYFVGGSKIKVSSEWVDFLKEKVITVWQTGSDFSMAINTSNILYIVKEDLDEKFKIKESQYATYTVQHDGGTGMSTSTAYAPPS